MKFFTRPNQQIDLDRFYLFTISRSLPIETNIWKGHKNKGEVSKNEGGISKNEGEVSKNEEGISKNERGISKMCVSPRQK
jgi:hypothetical protein